MAKPSCPRSDSGFSMVEMLVALMFMGVLMAGLASVFKSSLGTFYTAGEKTSSMRRNRSSLDLLYDDLNTAGLFLTDLVNQPAGLNPANPAFYILPNQPIAGAAADGPQTADELYFYLDQPLNFEGTLVAPAAGTGPQSASQMVQNGSTPTDTDATFTIDCKDPAYAAMVAVGQNMVFKDFYKSPFIKSVSSPDGTKVTVITGVNPTSLITGIGSTGAPETAVHLGGAGVVFYNPAQMIKYSVQMKLLDPANPTVGVPCLVRDQGAYSAAGFVATAPQQVIAENVTIPSGTTRANDGPFKAYLSANAGSTWAGWDVTTAGTTGWGAFTGTPAAGTIQDELNTQVAAAKRAGVTTTAGNLTWFRTIPAMVRMDITTRTATKRSEYSATGKTAAYNTLTQSLVLVPRHFGLTQN